MSFNLIGLDKDFANLRKGSFVEITGEIIGNCNEDGSKKLDLFINPKSIVKGGKNNGMAK